jgi:hypothetical protein
MVRSASDDPLEVRVVQELFIVCHFRGNLHLLFGGRRRSTLAAAALGMVHLPFCLLSLARWRLLSKRREQNSQTSLLGIVLLVGVAAIELQIRTVVGKTILTHFARADVVRVDPSRVNGAGILAAEPTEAAMGMRRRCC